ncbi:hypothetical protein LX36DRAFT_68492 [Colletotrichum falcatum]|nr:hypothetical protein LX36DRAFT_68492 [Colletotrichum falcatum]
MAIDPSATLAVCLPGLFGNGDIQRDTGLAIEEVAAGRNVSPTDLLSHFGVVTRHLHVRHSASHFGPGPVRPRLFGGHAADDFVVHGRTSVLHAISLGSSSSLSDSVELAHSKHGSKQTRESSTWARVILLVSWPLYSPIRAWPRRMCRRPNCDFHVNAASLRRR